MSIEQPLSAKLAKQQTMPKDLIPANLRPPALPRSENAPTPRAALALARSQVYQDATDAPAALRAYATDLVRRYRAAMGS